MKINYPGMGIKFEDLPTGRFFLNSQGYSANLFFKFFLKPDEYLRDKDGGKYNAILIPDSANEYAFPVFFDPDDRIFPVDGEINLSM